MSGLDLSTSIGYRRESGAPLLHTLATDFGKKVANLEELASSLCKDASVLESSLSDSIADSTLNSFSKIYRGERF